MDRFQYHAEIPNTHSLPRQVLTVDLLALPAADCESEELVIRLALEEEDPMEVVYADLGVADAQALAQHLANAAAVATWNGAGEESPGETDLPVIGLCDRLFVLDARMRELRSVANPEHRLGLDEPPQP